MEAAPGRAGEVGQAGGDGAEGGFDPGFKVRATLRSPSDQVRFKQAGDPSELSDCGSLESGEGARTLRLCLRTPSRVANRARGHRIR